MKERRSSTSRVLRTAIATSLVVTGILLAVTLYAYMDRVPQESAIWWLQFFLIALSFGIPALVLRSVMRSRRGRGPAGAMALAVSEEASAPLRKQA